MTTTKQIATVSVKADDAGEGIVDAVVATWDPDSVGDQIEKGAFDATLKEWEGRDENIPVIWSHQHNDPFSHIGEVVDAKETDEGLQVRQQLDLDNPTAKQVYKLIKGGRIRNYSFAYDVEDAEPSKTDEGVTKLKQLKLYEVGPTLIGANQATHTLDVKTARLKARNVGQYIESRIHRHFSTIADDLFGDGLLTREERVALSGGIGDALDALVSRVSADAPQLYERDVYDDPDRPALDDEAGDKAGTEPADSKGKEAQPTAPANDDDLNPDDDPQGKSEGKSDEPNQPGPVEALARYHALLQMS